MGKNKSEKLESIAQALKKDKAISFAYLFGSHARRKAGPLSDMDIAVFLKGGPNQEDILGRLSFKGVDVVVLNTATTLMQFNAIRDGIVLKDGPLRRPYEYRVMNSYLDGDYHERLQARIGIERIARRGLA